MRLFHLIQISSQLGPLQLQCTVLPYNCIMVRVISSYLCPVVSFPDPTQLSGRGLGTRRVQRLVFRNPWSSGSHYIMVVSSPDPTLLRREALGAHGMVTRLISRIAISIGDTRLYTTWHAHGTVRTASCCTCTSSYRAAGRLVSSPDPRPQPRGLGTRLLPGRPHFLGAPRTCR